MQRVQGDGADITLDIDHEFLMEEKAFYNQHLMSYLIRETSCNIETE